MPDGISSRLNIVPDHHPVLVVNPDGTPVSYPDCQVSWRRALKMLAMEVAFTLRPSTLIARSPGQEHEVPDVVMLKAFRKVVELHEPAAFNLRNLYIRDRGRCMYTDKALRLYSGKALQPGRPYPADMATFDHIHPKSRGGERGWENSVLASMPLNCFKGNRTPAEAGLRLKYPAWVPTRADLLKLELSEEGLQHMNVTWLEFFENIKASKRVRRVLELARAA